MIVMNLQDVLRDILGALRVQYLLLNNPCSSLEASSLDFQFRDQLYENFDYASFAGSIMKLVPDESVIDYRDDFGLHYLVFQGRGAESGRPCAAEAELVRGPDVLREAEEPPAFFRSLESRA